MKLKTWYNQLIHHKELAALLFLFVKLIIECSQPSEQDKKMSYTHKFLTSAIKQQRYDTHYRHINTSPTEEEHRPCVMLLNFEVTMPQVRKFSSTSCDVPLHTTSTILSKKRNPSPQHTRTPKREKYTQRAPGCGNVPRGAVSCSFLSFSRQLRNARIDTQTL